MCEGKRVDCYCVCVLCFTSWSVCTRRGLSVLCTSDDSYICVNVSVVPCEKRQVVRNIDNFCYHKYVCAEAWCVCGASCMQSCEPSRLHMEPRLLKLVGVREKVLYFPNSVHFLEKGVFRSVQNMLLLQKKESLYRNSDSRQNGV